MQPQERQRLTQVEARVLRHPDQARDVEIDRAATRLMAARSDTPQLLLLRVLELEAALQQIGQQLHQAGTEPPPAAAGADEPAASAAQRTTPSASRSFLRDTAVVTTGVLGGSLLLHGLASALDDASPSDVASGEGTDLDLDTDFFG